MPNYCRSRPNLHAQHGTVPATKEVALALSQNVLISSPMCMETLYYSAAS